MDPKELLEELKQYRIDNDCDVCEIDEECTKYFRSDDTCPANWDIE